MSWLQTFVRATGAGILLGICIWIASIDIAFLVLIVALGAILGTWAFVGAVGPATNVFSYIAGIPLSLMIGRLFGVGMASIVNAVATGWGDWLVVPSAVLVGVAYYLLGLIYNKIRTESGETSNRIPTAYGAVLNILGIRLPFELREGQPFVPFGFGVSKTLSVEEKESIIKDTTALAPDNIPVTVAWFFQGRVRNVFRALSVGDPWKSLADIGERDVRTFIQSRTIEGIDVGQTAVEKKQNGLDHLRIHVDRELQNECERFGMEILETYVTDMRLPPKLEDAATQKAVEKEQAQARMVNVEGLGARVNYLKTHNLSPETALNAAQAEIGTASRAAFDLENLDKLVGFARRLLRAKIKKGT